MYGDHQPYIEDTFYEEVMGKKLSELTDEEQQKRYITRFVLWANYDIPEGWIDEISVNYLSVLLQQVANNPLTEYQKYLNTLYTKVPVVTMMGCRDWDGNYFKYNDDTKYRQLLNYYRQAIITSLMKSIAFIHYSICQKRKKMNPADPPIWWVFSYEKREKFIFPLRLILPSLNQFLLTDQK